jgi:hypothetical protein
VADALHLDEEKNAGVFWIQAIILLTVRAICSRHHIAKLAPLIAKEYSLFTIVKLLVKSVVTKDYILHRLFSELFVEKFALYQPEESEDARMTSWDHIVWFRMKR